MSCKQNAGQNHIINTDNKSFGSLADFKYLVMTLTCKKCMNEYVDSKLNSGNAATIKFITFLFSVSYLKIQRLRYAAL